MRFYSRQERLESTITVTDHSLAEPLACPGVLPQEHKLPGDRMARLVRLQDEHLVFLEPTVNADEGRPQAAANYTNNEKEQVCLSGARKQMLEARAAERLGGGSASL